MRSAVRSTWLFCWSACTVIVSTRPTTVCSATRVASTVSAPSWLSDPAAPSRPTANHQAPPRRDFKQSADGLLRARERPVFEHLAEHPDEDDLGRDERLINKDGRDTRQGQGQVGPKPSLEETFERGI